MGVAFKDLITSSEIDLDTLRGKVLVLDGFNILYQFLTTIRGPDGAVLTDRKGDTTSHLVGLFSRSTNLMQRGLKLAFVFDGEAPELKRQEQQRRATRKQEAEEKFLVAQEKEDHEEMKKYAARTSRLTTKAIAEAKELLNHLGLPYVQAPSEGEAQAAHMVKRGDGFAVGSQDYDALLQGAPIVVRNLSIAGKRRKSKTFGSISVKPERVDLADTLNTLGVDMSQLVALAMIVGTDYNYGGIKGIGPKNALKLVKKHGSDLDALFSMVKWDRYFPFPWKDVYYTIKTIPVTDDYTLTWKPINTEHLTTFLVQQHDFGPERVKTTIDKITKTTQQQKSLGDF